MNLDFSPEDNAFRAEVRAFLEENYPKETAERQARGEELTKEDYTRWHKILFERGWSTPFWPKEYGGTGWSPTQKFIWQEENARIDALMLPAFSVSHGRRR